MKIDIQIDLEAEYPRFSLNVQNVSLKELGTVMDKAKKLVATQATEMLDFPDDEKKKEFLN